MTTPVQPTFQPAAPPQGQPAAPPLDPRPVTGAELNRRIQHGDQNFPPELWGRTMGEAIRYYGIMRQDFVARQSAQQNQQPLQGQPAQQPAQRPQPQYQPAPQQPPNTPPTGYIPPAQQTTEVPLTLEGVQRVVQETLTRAMAPMAQASAVSVQQQMRSKFADWMQYEQAILAELQGVDPTGLLNPSLWESAYYYVKGKWHTENPQRQQLTGYAPQQVNPPAPGGPIYQPVPSEFFSEAPTPPSVQQNAAGQLNDPLDEVYARRFGMPVEEYRAWKGGRVPVPQRQQPTQQPSPNGAGGGWR